MFRLLHCVARAVVKNAGKLFLNFMPGGEVLYDIAHESYEEYRRIDDQDALRGEIAALASASAKEIQNDVRVAVLSVASDQPQETQERIVHYLSQIPATIRRSLRRSSDPTGTTVPSSLSLQSGDDLVRLLPTRPTQFQAGQRPLPGLDWELVDLLGVGGFGEVWLARHATMRSKKPVALKFCLDPTAAAVLRNEAGVLDHLQAHGSHPGIVALQEVYLKNDPPCLQYDYVEGGDLAGLLCELKQSGKLTLDRANALFLHLVGIVAHAHSAKPAIVHCDLKPANILVQRNSSGKLQLRITDFGIGGLAALKTLEQTRGRATSRQELLTEAVRGAHTPLYASPEQKRRRRGEPADPRDDIHALGVIWFQLLTGDLTLETMPTDWRDVLSENDVPGEQLDLLARCLTSRVERRVPDAVRLRGELQSLLRTCQPTNKESPPPPPKEMPTWKVVKELPNPAPEQPQAQSSSPLATLSGGIHVERMFHRNVMTVLGETAATYALVKLIPVNSGWRPPRIGVNLALALDVSGSMYEEDGTGICRLKRVQDAAIAAIQKLAPEDTMTVVAFGFNAGVLLPPTKVAEKAKIEDVIRKIDMYDVDPGGTAMDEGIYLALGELRKLSGPGKISQVVVLTDGETSGEQNCRLLAQQARQDKIQMALMGIGQDWKASLIKELADLSGGKWYYIDANKKEEAERIFVEEFDTVASTSFKDVEMRIKMTEDIKLKRVRMVVPEVKELWLDEVEKHTLVAQLGNMGYDLPKCFIFDLTLSKRPDGKFLIAQVEITYDNGTGTRKSTGIVALELTYNASSPSPPNAEVMKHIDDIQLCEMNKKLQVAIASGNKEEAIEAARQMEEKGNLMGGRAAKKTMLARQILEEVIRVGRVSKKTMLAIDDASRFASV